MKLFKKPHATTYPSFVLVVFYPNHFALAQACQVTYNFGGFGGTVIE